MLRVLCIILLLESFAICEERPKVKIEQGLIQGKYSTSRKGRTFSAFTGIPFAKPPVGNLRFEPAVPAEPWDGIFDASNTHPACPQIDPFLSNGTITGEEDCLYLNVYTPKTENSSELLPVMYFIHGGAYFFWSAKPELFGPEYLLDKDIVLVAANYRLGPLGFLSTGDEIAPGNIGLKDQTFVLKWIKKNIEKFGGNPESVTVFGESAGGACAHLHALSPLSKDLITGVIAQSGTGVGIWSVSEKEHGVRNTKKFADLVNCPTESSKELVECLRKMDVQELIRQEINFLKGDGDSSIMFMPVIEPNHDDAFLTQHPFDIYKSGKVANIPLMTGITTEEGAIQSAVMYRSPELIGYLDKNFNKLAPTTLGYEATEDSNDVPEKVLKYYFTDGKVTNTSQDELTKMYTDSMFTIPTDAAVRLHSKFVNQPTYYYLFGYRGSQSFGDVLGGGIRDYGVCHCDDLLYLFKIGEFGKKKQTESDKEVTDIVLSLWANFAKTGNPTPEVSKVSTKWEPVKDGDIKIYFIKNENDIKMIDNVFSDRLKFWDDLSIKSRYYHVSKEL